MKSSIIELKDLTKEYGTLKAVNKLNLDIEKGEVFGLLGPNGAGKSTTILMMLGLTEPTSGYARVCGFDATSAPIEVKKRVGYLPDNVGFYENRTGLENLAYIARLNRMAEKEIKPRALELLKRVGLENVAHKKVGTYSRGMKQRLGLADVLIKNPEVIILDEPTLGIDPSGVREFLELIRRLSREQQLTVLLSSHHLHQVQQVCDRVGIFVRGSMIARGDIPALSKTLFNSEPYIVEVEIKPPFSPENHPIKDILCNIREVSSVKQANERMLIACTSDITPVIAKTLVEANLNIQYLCRKEYGLDDIYQRYFEGNHENYPKIA
ncbi:ABC transporter ATP-binding protein [Sinomicrobium kalidii]|uniref:ABC transporter ATP-binding protein n=1 Tax=Sinomicrobium kalidii TaxID=2900738 RepID=UPI001E344F93|nr:ABC transporter ATP-binding protein [Sinomicrobium kalidii]UGU17528.1 ABC transporter ATP-binding protein [Sinomicrobium kalidii]